MFWIPVIVALSATGVYVKHKKANIGVMTPARQTVYNEALRTLKDPVKLRTLAASFKKYGLPSQAELLTKRAKLRELPEDIKVQRREAIRKAFKSSNADAVEAFADVCETEGATGAAQSLRVYAAGLRKLPNPEINPIEETAPTEETTTEIVESGPPAGEG